MRRDEARQLLEDAVTRWRGDATRFGERAGDSLGAIARQLGLVTREEMDELELRVAQLEHRLRLVERPRAVPDPPDSAV
jgi:polyhydroxyalkanoate synthesis regulator phasin